MIYNIGIGGFNLMGDKTGATPGPEQLVQSVGLGIIVTVDIDLMPQLEGFFR